MNVYARNAYLFAVAAAVFTMAVSLVAGASWLTVTCATPPVALAAWVFGRAFDPYWPDTPDEPGNVAEELRAFTGFWHPVPDDPFASPSDVFANVSADPVVARRVWWRLGKTGVKLRPYRGKRRREVGAK